MPHVTIVPLRSAASAPGLPAAPSNAVPDAHLDAPDRSFWCPSIGTGASAVFALCPQVDAMSQHVAGLPIRVSVTRPVVGQYLVMLKTLAAAWSARSRPALVSAIGALVHVGDSLAQSFTLEALAGCHADNGRAALRVLDALQRRLAAPLDGLAALERDVSSYLAQMTGASAELDADTQLVTQRLQSDYVHAFTLSQQASSLHHKLDDATLRAPGLAGPHSGKHHQQMRLYASALEGVRHQLDHLRAEQSATQAEADYLQSLLPTLSTYLATVEQMGGAIQALLGGERMLARELDALRQALARETGAAGNIQAQLSAALPHWHALAASSALLRSGALS